MYRNNRAVQRIVSLLILLQATISTGAMSILSGKRVLVTGAGRGIGRAIANICAGEGAKVAICSRTKAELEETMAELEATTQFSNMGMYIVDLKEQEQVDRMVSSIVDEFGGIDILINNAGGSQAGKGPAYELPTSDLKDILDLNIVSVHSVTSSVLQKTMLKNGSGRIINISSKAGKVGFPNMSFYCASKFALEGYSATIAEELKDKHIIVNTISPGMVNTSSFPKAKGKKGVRTAESVKDALLLLLTTEKTGHYVHVDELDEVKGRGLDDDMALKPINEAPFSV
jgi:short-subunit dehydrogenase